MYANTLRETFGKIYKEVENMYYTLTDEYEDIEKKFKWEKETNTMMQSKTSEMETRINELLETLNERNKDYSTIARENKSLNNEIQEQQEWIDKLEMEREDTKEEIKGLRTIISDLTTFTQNIKSELESRKRFMKECGLEDHYQSKRQTPVFPGYGQTNSISEQAIIDLEAEETEEDGISEIPRDPKTNVLEGIF